MVRPKSSANKQYVVNFTDHTGQLAKMTWSNPPRNILIPLASICLYFVHPALSLDDLNMSYADHAQHYRDELKARGDAFEQVQEAEKAYENWEDKETDVQYAAEQEPHGKLPGLTSSQKGACIGFHSVLYVYKDPAWNHEDEEQSVDVVEFDPALAPDDYEPGEPEMRGPQPPFKITRISAKRKPKVLRYDDQGVWLWFFDHRSWDWWDLTTTATSQAQHMGWTSW
ncbi:hypothetical protein Forpe1208_v014336 [Fusarium oxysporum f. sp. rapae]|uniref:Uncharacterized protein n=1 Tax=Fusarium oxysporum f. sp. rapae TaxID=485398 RepID=A0A8J5NL18_FUSOX|nr:hypothetical protein Forpe1208_v014336 [Fusarium oxysporum f. sp. rapae]